MLTMILLGDYRSHGGWLALSGCGFDWLDVQVDDEIITGLVISQVDGTDCSAGSTECQYKLNWKVGSQDLLLCVCTHSGQDHLASLCWLHHSSLSVR